MIIWRTEVEDSFIKEASVILRKGKILEKLDMPIRRKVLGF